MEEINKRNFYEDAAVSGVVICFRDLLILAESHEQVIEEAEETGSYQRWKVRNKSCPPDSCGKDCPEPHRSPATPRFVTSTLWHLDHQKTSKSGTLHGLRV